MWAKFDGVIENSITQFVVDIRTPTVDLFVPCMPDDTFSLCTEMTHGTQ